jgi:electron transfer flavoprotein beta subunit
MHLQFTGVTLKVSAGLNIIVCIKQVPEATDVEFDKTTGRLKRDGAAAIINPFDEFAIEAALRIKEKHNGTVKVLSMGPPSAEQALRDAIAMGCDEGWLATDRVFGGADTWATSFTLAKCIQSIGKFDIVVCGLKTTDGDTGQTGPEIAEHLNVPCINYVSEFIGIKDGVAMMKRNLDDGVETLAVPLPTIITVSKDIGQPRLATLRGRLAAKRITIRQITNKELAMDPNTIGLDGSPTRVIKIFTPEPIAGGEVVEGPVDKLADAIFIRLKEAKVL